MARTASPSAPVGAGRVVLRVLAIVFLAYAAASAIVAAGVAALILGGLDRSDAFTACSILGFLIYVVLALWAAAAPRLLPLVSALLAITAGGAAVGFLPSLMGGT